MFEDKKITIEKVKDLLYSVENEFNNELDYDYESESGYEFTEKEFEIMEEYLDRYINKVYLTLEDELENWKESDK